MRRFLFRLIAFSLPFLVYAAIVIVIDPYVRFGVTSVVPEATKKAVAEPVNYALWATLSFDRSPAPNLLLGSSNMGLLDEDEVSRVAGRRYRNLALGGGAIVESINMFWHAARRVSLESVYMSVDLQAVNQFMDRDRVKAAEAVDHNPLLYFSSRDVLTTTVQLAAVRFFHASVENGHPDMSKEDFWRYQLEVSSTRALYGFRFDEPAFRKLEEIVAYCRERHIALTFVMLPKHADLQTKVREFGLEEAQTELHRRLEAIAPVVSLDGPGELTERRENFSDPYHMTHEVASRVVQMVWGATTAQGRPLSSPTQPPSAPAASASE
jgi:hypothetical protein